MTYVASNGIASPDFTLVVNASMVLLLPSMSWATLLTALMTLQPLTEKPVSTSARTYHPRVNRGPTVTGHLLRLLANRETGVDYPPVKIAHRGRVS